MNADRKTELLKILFDLVVGSMGFGSRFFDEEDVQAMREVAALIGVDPMLGTPYNMKCRFEGKHDEGAILAGHGLCWRCHSSVTSTPWIVEPEPYKLPPIVEDEDE